MALLSRGVALGRAALGRDEAGGGGGDLELVVADAAHGHSVDALTLSLAGALVVGDAAHGHAADSPALSQAFALAAADAAHGHAADNLTLAGPQPTYVDGFVDISLLSVPVGGTASVSYTTVEGTDGLLIGMMTRDWGQPAGKVTGITFDGIALTQVGPIVEAWAENGTDQFGWMMFWKLANPPIKTADIVVTAAADAPNIMYTWLAPCCTHGTTDDVIDTASFEYGFGTSPDAAYSLPISVATNRTALAVLWSSGDGGATIAWDSPTVAGGSGSTSSRVFRSGHVEGPVSAMGVTATADILRPTIMAVLLDEAVAGSLAVSDAQHARTADGLSLAQGYSLGVSEALHGHSVDNLALIQGNVLASDGADHGHTAESPTLVQGHVLASNDATHSHAADGVSLEQGSVLAPAGADHGHSADSVALTQASMLVVAETLHDHTAESPVLSHLQVLAVAGADHGHAADNVGLSSGNTLAPSKALHSHSADSIGLTQGHVLAIQGALHAHGADDVNLSQAVILTVSAALHAHTADAVGLTQGHMLAVQDALHQHMVDAVDLVSAGTLTVADALHAHRVDAVYFDAGTARAVLVVPDRVRTLRVGARVRVLVVAPRKRTTLH